MAQSSRIKTPFKQHLHRFRLGALPVLSFFLCVVVTLWLWERQASVGSFIGEIESQTVIITAGANGELLAQESGEYWRRGQRLKKGDFVAGLSDTEIIAQMRVVQAETAKLAADLGAAETQLLIDLQRLQQNRDQEVIRAQFNKESRRLAAFKQTAVVTELQQQLKVLASRRESLQKFGGLSGQAGIGELDAEIAKTTALLEAERRTLQLATKQYQDAKELVAQEVESPEVETVLAPIRAQQKIQAARQEELQAIAKSLIVTAPIDGQITEVHRLPGEHVRAGDPLLTIAVPANYIVSYMRENSTPVRPGMKVAIRLRNAPNPATATEYVSRVEAIGPAVRPVPPHQLPSQDAVEYGNPVYIPIPDALQQLLDNQQVVPGQLLNLIYEPRK